MHRAAETAPQHSFENELAAAGKAEEVLQLEDLYPVRLPITAELGSCRLTVRDILSMDRGTVFALEKLAGEMADLYVNGVPFAKGELVVIGDSLHVRVAEIRGVAESELRHG